MSEKKVDKKLYWPTALVLALVVISNVVVVALTDAGADRYETLAIIDGTAAVVLAFMNKMWGFTAVVAIVFATSMVGCGATPQQRSAYALEQARCLANQRDIARRPNTTYGQDIADFEAEVARCDAALDAIEAGGQ